MIRWKQSGMGFSYWGLEYNNPDLVRYAECYGAYGHRVSSVEGFSSTIDMAFRDGGVHLIDCPVDYSSNVKDLITYLAQHQPII